MGQILTDRKCTIASLASAAKTWRIRPVGTYPYYMEKEWLSTCDRVIGKGFQEVTGKFYKPFTAA